MIMEDKIIAMLEDEAYFKDIFETLHCTDEEFLKALSKQQQYEFKTVKHNDPLYNGATVAF